MCTCKGINQLSPNSFLWGIVVWPFLLKSIWILFVVVQQGTKVSTATATVAGFFADDNAGK